MTKREIIREGIAKQIRYIATYRPDYTWEEIEETERRIFLAYANHFLTYLHSQGVVIKGMSLGASHPHLASYFTVEPLIEEK